MSNKLEVDIRGSINTAVDETAKDVLGFLVVAFVFGFAFAPWFSPFFRAHLEEKYKINQDPRRQTIVNEKMAKINLGLWITAIISWILIFAAYAAYNG